MSIHEYYIKIKSLELQKLKEEAVMANKEDIIKLNTGQLSFGKTSKDENIVPEYSDLYLKRKTKMSSYVAELGTPDLYVTGAFYAGFDLIVENGEYSLISWDPKNQWLAVRYNDIYGLDQDSIEKAQVFCTNTLLELVSTQLNN
jgi:hypothetical protein